MPVADYTSHQVAAGWSYVWNYTMHKTKSGLIRMIAGYFVPPPPLHVVWHIHLLRTRMKCVFPCPDTNRMLTPGVDEVNEAKGRLLHVVHYLSAFTSYFPRLQPLPCTRVAVKKEDTRGQELSPLGDMRFL